MLLLSVCYVWVRLKGVFLFDLFFTNTVAEPINFSSVTFSYIFYPRETQIEKAYAKRRSG